jgi:hypothetical protein
MQYGVWGEADQETGVIGTSNSQVRSGVFGRNDIGAGVFGWSDENTGVYGTSVQQFGVVGEGSSAGVAAFNGKHQQVSAYLAAEWLFGGALAGLFNGGTLVVGDFGVTGTKSAIVQHPDGSHRRLYCMESPDSWFEDFGIGHLHDGQADVHLAPDFAALVRTDNYQVFLTAYGDCNGLYIARMQPHEFVVREQQGGKHSLEFAYRVVAKRRDVDVVRLQPVQIPVQPVAPERPSQPRHSHPPAPHPRP